MSDVVTRDNERFHRWLISMARTKASDLFITVGLPPQMLTDRGIVSLGDDKMSSGDVRNIVDELMTADQMNAFQAKLEFNRALSLGERIGRFRINFMMQQGEPAVVIRRISAVPPTLEQMKLPPLLGDLVCEKRGILLLVGSTGSGKSTTLAAMVDHRNRTQQGHILTVEDPIEYVHTHKMSIIHQREIGVDTHSYHDALSNALRQRPFAIQIGEIREREVMQHALNIAETGHLAMSTLHANNADQAIDRIVNFFETKERAQALLNLSFNVRGIISQRLVRATDGGRVLAMEILLNQGEVTRLIREGDTSKLKQVMRASEDVGMVTFDRCLERLWREGKISKEVALAEADDRVTMRAEMGDFVPDAIAASVAV